MPNKRKRKGNNCGWGAQSHYARSKQLASANPTKTGYGLTLRRADRALVQRLGQGTRERDGQKRAGRWTASLMGTWPALHRSGMQAERADSHSHPAEPMARGSGCVIWEIDNTRRDA